MTKRVAQPSADKIINRRLHNARALACLLLLHLHFVVAAHAQVKEPITRKKVYDTLNNRKGGLNGQKYLEKIREEGVIFRVTPSDERTFRSVGKHLGVQYLNEVIAAARNNYRPKTPLSGNIERVLVEPGRDGGAHVFIQLTVKNGGRSTSAQQYFVRIMHETSTILDVKGEASDIEESFSLQQEGASEKLVVLPTDDIIRKTRQTIPSGGAESGWLRFDLTGEFNMPGESMPFTVESLRRPGTWFVVSFADANGQPYEAVLVR